MEKITSLFDVLGGYNALNDDGASVEWRDYEIEIEAGCQSARDVLEEIAEQVEFGIRILAQDFSGGGPADLVPQSVCYAEIEGKFFRVCMEYEQYEMHTCSFCAEQVTEDKAKEEAARINAEGAARAAAYAAEEEEALKKGRAHWAAVEEEKKRKAEAKRKADAENTLEKFFERHPGFTTDYPGYPRDGKYRHVYFGSLGFEGREVKREFESIPVKHGATWTEVMDGRWLVIEIDPGQNWRK